MSRSMEEPAGGAPRSGDTPAGSLTFPASLAAVVVTSTVPSEADAIRISELVVLEHLAACVQVQGPIWSTFRWKGQVDNATEWYVHCKTAPARALSLVARLKDLHPYEVPEIIITPVLGGFPPYLAWVEEMVREKRAAGDGE